MRGCCRHCKKGYFRIRSKRRSVCFISAFQRKETAFRTTIASEHRTLFIWQISICFVFNLYFMFIFNYDYWV